MLRSLSLIALLAAAAYGHTRPPITGISHMCVYASDMAASDHFYLDILAAAKGPDPQNPAGARYYFSPNQFVEVLPLPAGQGISRMACVGWQTTDATALRAYLAAHNVANLSDVQTVPGGTKWFETKDPEGNTVQFVQPEGVPQLQASPSTSISQHIIHVGYLVHDSAAENHFYRDILGFRPYWFGAKNPGKTDWISQQVPDGHDWLEYMMVGSGSDVAQDKVDARQLGVLNHFSIGVENMETAVTILYREKRLPARHDGPQMGLDGKWQANWYDPDGTRVELMEFQPAIEPCCSPFTADSPKN